MKDVDYGLTPEMGKGYEQFITQTTDHYAMVLKKFKHSEFKDPNAEDYETMDTQYDWSWDEIPPWSIDFELPTIPQVGEPGSQPTTDAETFRYSCTWVGKQPTKIGYSKSTMCVNKSQTLCIDNQHHPTSVYTWSLMGDGFLSSTKGATVVYTAPATNPDCGKSATVTLRCGAETCDSVTFAISSCAGGDAYYQYCHNILNFNDCPPSPWLERRCVGWRVTKIIECDGDLRAQYSSCLDSATIAGYYASHPSSTIGMQQCPSLSNVYQACFSWLPYCLDAKFCDDPEYGTDNTCEDKRSPEQKAAGCCPQSC